MDFLKGMLAVWFVLHVGPTTATRAWAEEVPQAPEGVPIVTDDSGTVTLQKLTREEAVKLIKAGALVVDVRSPEEFEGGHLEGAVNVPHTDIGEHLEVFGADKSRAVLLYCRSGRRAELARIELRALGYTNVANGGAYKDLRGVQ